MKWHAPVGNQTAACECGPITYPLGPDALGLMMYTGDGYMSAVDAPWPTCSQQRPTV
jgi:hypothetical protein